MPDLALGSRNGAVPENFVTDEMVYEWLHEASPFVCIATLEAEPTWFGVDSHCVERQILLRCGLDPARHRAVRALDKAGYLVEKRDA
mgnify:CR=1 FL=1